LGLKKNPPRTRDPPKYCAPLTPLGSEERKAPFSGAEEQTARAISTYAQSANAQCAFLISLQMGSTHQTRLGSVDVEGARGVLVVLR
jgi:hypothetical protein